MAMETGAGAVWAALLGLALWIATTITAGWWFCIYRAESQQLEPLGPEPPTTLELIWNDLPLSGR